MKGLKLYKEKLSGHNDSIIELFSPKGEFGGLLISISCDGNLRIWDLFDKKILTKYYLRRDPDNAYDDNGNLKRLDMKEYIEKAFFNENTVFCCYQDGSIWAWNIASGDLIYKFKGHEDKITCGLMINPTCFVTGSYDRTQAVWDSLKAVTSSVFQFHDSVKGLVEHKGLLYVLVGDNELNVIDISENHVQATIVLDGLTVTTFTVTDKIFIVADSFNNIYSTPMEELYTAEPRKFFHVGHTNRIFKIVKHGDFVFSVSDDKTAKVWSYPEMELRDELTGHQNGICSITFANHHIYTGSYDYTIRSWDFEEMVERIGERSRIAEQHLYSLKADLYKTFLNKNQNKKKKKAPKKSVGLIR